MEAPESLTARSSDGTQKVLVAAGASLPASAKIVFATTRGGQEAISIDLLEGEERHVASARFALPRGLPANCWIPIFVSVGADLRVQAEARENLRRLRVDAEFDSSERAAEHYSV